MSTDANGNFSLPPSYFVQTGDTVLPVQHNPPFESVAQGLTNRLMKDGRTVMTGNLQMGGNKVTNVAPGTNDGDALNVLQLRDRMDAVADFATVADMLADNNQRIGYAVSGARAIVSPGQIITSQGFRYEVAAGDAVDAHVETAGGVKLRVLKDGAGAVSLSSLGSGADALTKLLLLPEQGYNRLIIDRDVVASAWDQVAVTGAFELIGASGTGVKPLIKGPPASRKKFIKCTRAWRVNNIRFENFDILIEMNGDEIGDNVVIDRAEMSSVDTNNVLAPVWFTGPNWGPNMARVLKVEIRNNIFLNWVYGFFQHMTPAIDDLIVEGNLAVGGKKNFVQAHGSNQDSTYTLDVLKTARVLNNTVRDIFCPDESTSDTETIISLQGEEVQAFMIRSRAAFILGNEVSNVDSIYQDGTEGIYTKAIYAEVVGNKTHNAGRRDGSIVVKSAGHSSTGEKLSSKALIALNEVTWSPDFGATFNPPSGAKDGFGIYAQNMQDQISIIGNSVQGTARGIGIGMNSDDVSTQINIANNSVRGTLFSDRGIMIRANLTGARIGSALISGNIVEADIEFIRIRSDNILVDGCSGYGIKASGGARIDVLSVVGGKCSGVLAVEAGTLVKAVILKGIMKDRRNVSQELLTVADAAQCRYLNISDCDCAGSRIIRWTVAGDPVKGLVDNNAAEAVYDEAGAGRVPSTISATNTRVVTPSDWAAILA